MVCDVECMFYACVDMFCYWFVNSVVSFFIFSYLVVWLISDIVFSFTLLFYLWLFGLFDCLLWFVCSGLAV